MCIRDRYILLLSSSVVFMFLRARIYMVRHNLLIQWSADAISVIITMISHWIFVNTLYKNLIYYIASQRQESITNVSVIIYINICCAQYVTVYIVHAKHECHLPNHFKKLCECIRHPVIFFSIKINSSRDNPANYIGKY